MTRAQQPIPAEFYDKAYFVDGSKSNYAPYGPGGWARDITSMVVEFLNPSAVLDVGCAYGYVVDMLNERGVSAGGFDISEYAVQQGSQEIWVGDASLPDPYVETDLILATEMPEHLTEDQARAFLRHAYTYGHRALMLIAMHADGEEVDTTHEKDLSHINIKPVSWWIQESLRARWKIGDASSFNTDVRSGRMSWNGRWLYLEKE